MNPLSPLTYYRRHKRQAALLMAFMALAVMGLYLFIGLGQETFYTPARLFNRYLSKFSLVHVWAFIFWGSSELGQISPESKPSYPG